MSRGEADVAVRAVRPKDARPVVRKVADFELRLYASEAYLARRGAPRGSLDGHEVVAYHDELRSAGALRLAGAPARRGR
ncbi:MAG TPA: hypothetical protein VFS43_04050 [Polyangiaceae bacterium]|nr:hypothetical protein [Polyangiaceae bacterium]